MLELGNLKHEHWLKNSWFLEHSCSMSSSQKNHTGCRQGHWGGEPEGQGGAMYISGGGVIFLTIYFARKSALAGLTLGNAGKQFFSNSSLF